MTALNELMTVDEVAELLRVPRSTVSGWARVGTLPSIKLGRHRRFVRADVVDAIEQLRRQTPTPTGRGRVGASLRAQSGGAPRSR